MTSHDQCIDPSKMSCIMSSIKFLEAVLFVQLNVNNLKPLAWLSIHTSVQATILQ